jgi:hypothetical protein
MKTKTLIIIIIVSLSFSVFLLFTLERPSVKLVELNGSKSKDKYRIQGIEDAKQDINKGLLKLERYGYPLESIVDYELVLQEFKIELVTVAGCVINDKITGHSEGYNYIMREEIKKKHGPDFFKFVKQETDKRYKQRIKKH